MAKEAQLVLGITSEIGHMMADPNYCPENVKQDDIMNFFTSIINEQDESYKLKHADLVAMTKDINSYFNGVTHHKNSLIAEESAEAAADLVAAAAMIAAAAGSWIPFVNFGLAATAIAATATAMGLEIASEKLEKTVVEEISSADTAILNKYQSFNAIKVYSASVTANALFYPRLQLGATIRQMRALFIGVVVVIKKTNNGKCTAQDMKKAFLDYYNATQANPALVDKFIQIMQQLDDGGDPQKFKQDMDAFFQPLPEAVVRGYASIMLAFAAAVAMKQGKTAYQAYKAAKAAMPVEIEMVELDENGAAVEGGAAEVELTETIGIAEVALRAAGVLAGIATLVFAGLEIAKAVDTDNKLTKAIADAKTGIINYYTALVTKTIDGEGEQLITPILGNYECHKYDSGGKNDWHYVTISKVDENTLKWTNRAGVSWSLKLTSHKTILDVGSECPYYNFNDGTQQTHFTHATLVWDGNKVTGIMGPWNELYSKS